MVKVGLDFSFSSASFCIKNYRFYKWVVIMNKKAGKKSFNYNIRKNIQNTNEVKIYVMPNLGHRGKNKDQYWIEDRVLWSKKVISILENNIYWFNNNVKTSYFLNIEDTSYSKLTNNIIDVTSGITLLKKELLNSDYCDGWNTYSPSKVKKNLGVKGNASKLDVIKYFQNENESLIKYSNFWGYVKDLSILKEKDIQHHKPIDDCIDAYGLVEFN